MQLPERDMIVLRLGIPPVAGKKIRFFEERDMLALTKLAPPTMPTIRPDPHAANNSLRVIAAAEADDERGGAPSFGNPLAGRTALAPAREDAQTVRQGLNKAAIDAAMAVPRGERTAKLFEHIVVVAPSSAS